MNETGYNIVQINGQRISTSPRIDRRPLRGCEVFVGKIPRDCYEDELFPIFQTAGPVHELRLMMMFSGTNRGYAFVMYERLQDARRAVDRLDNLEIRRGHRIGVLPCVNNCRLFVGCFDAEDRSEVQLQQTLRSETEHVVSVSRRSGRSGRWYLLVEYANHRAAAIARRELTPRRTQLFGPRVIVDWEIPVDKRGRKPAALDQRRALKNNYPPVSMVAVGGPGVCGLQQTANVSRLADSRVMRCVWMMELQWKRGG
ncbi:hypothetical protein ONE63_007981 [Megalurothrips usitatus]|uniref:RRM domain-containing protein n=1 Tax=Megalurothrips usitatus TaxID=439358 RepID=A0AAV7XPE7_9NEOP|nr:hypothetical protein ONE63_007981 [Megalurothrips usitatus]